MKNFFQKIAFKFYSFMQGRYGTDELSMVLLFIYLGTCLVALIPYGWVVFPFGLAAGIFGIYRCFSKNRFKRNIEREWYEGKKHKIKKFFRRRKRIYNERKTHKFFKCKKCKAVLRVPKGKGKIEITCPKCGNKITKKT